jgi:ABC-type transport system substrate-binding protein
MLFLANNLEGLHGEEEEMRKRIESNRLTRREFMRATALVAGAAVPLPALAAPAPAVAVKRGGTLVHACNWTVPTMDAHLTSYREHAVYESVYNGLVRLQLADPKTWEHKVVSDLAESWQQPDARTIIFKLRQGVKFHDGSDFDAEVAKWNLLRARDHAKSQLKSGLSPVASVETLDKYTLQIKAKSDNAALLRVLAHTTAGLVRMVSKAAMDKIGEEGIARNPVGTGPFKFKQWITDDRVILVRNPDYFENGADGKPLPYLDEVIMRYIPDPSVSLVDMRAGALHLLEWALPKDAAIIRGDPNLALEELPWGGQIYFKVGYNTKATPFNDVRVRQAANYGIDRVAMHKALGFDVGAPYYYPYWIPGTLGYDETIMKYEYNPAKVKELLTAAGYPDGVSVELKVIAREPENTIGEFVQQMWTAVGLKTKLVSMERLSWIDAVRANRFQACFWRGALWAFVDPESARTLVGCGAPTNWANWCDPEVDKLLNEGLVTLDPRKRQAIYRNMWQIIQERAYAGTGFLAPMLNAHRRNVQGLTYNFTTPTLGAVWMR